MSECTHNCSTCGENCSSRNTPQSLLEPVNSLSTVGKVYAVVSGKGGVGKSTVTSLLSVMTAKKGFKTAVLDADITGPSIPKMLGINERAMADDNGIYPGVSKSGVRAMSLNMLVEDETTPVIWRGPVIAGTVKQFWTDVIWGDIDCMYIDMPPGTGDIPLTVFQSIPVDGIIIVTSPQDLVSMIVDKAVNMAEKMQVKNAKVMWIYPLSDLLRITVTSAVPIAEKNIIFSAKAVSLQSRKSTDFPFLPVCPSTRTLRNFATRDVWTNMRQRLSTKRFPNSSATKLNKII